jgi:hypothetical protein
MGKIMTHRLKERIHHLTTINLLEGPYRHRGVQSEALQNDQPKIKITGGERNIVMKTKGVRTM